MTREGHPTPHSPRPWGSELQFCSCKSSQPNLFMFHHKESQLWEGTAGRRWGRALPRPRVNQEQLQPRVPLLSLGHQLRTSPLPAEDE